MNKEYEIFRRQVETKPVKAGEPQMHERVGYAIEENDTENLNIMLEKTIEARETCWLKPRHNGD